MSRGEYGRMRVLIIEGSQKLRAEVHRALEKRGCEVVSAWDAQDVRGFLATHPERIDVAVVDCSMVDSDPELIGTLRAQHPDLQVLLTLPEAGRDEAPTGYAVLRKPIDPLDLTRVVLDLGAPRPA